MRRKISRLKSTCSRPATSKLLRCHYKCRCFEILNHVRKVLSDGFHHNPYKLSVGRCTRSCSATYVTVHQNQIQAPPQSNKQDFHILQQIYLELSVNSKRHHLIHFTYWTTPQFHLCDRQPHITNETLLRDDRFVSTKRCYASIVREVAMPDWNGMSLIYRCLGFNKWTQLCVSKYDNKWHNQTHRNANNDLVNSNQCSAYTCFVTAEQTI